tara:strand:- start:1320 stop:1580 length:261 start_codon:yes stop_codon:yes gene_type:complete
MKDWKDILYDKEMKKITLIQRLKPEYKGVLDSSNVDYPSLIGSIVETLEQVDFVCNLKYSTVMDLQLVFKSDSSPYEFFNEHKTYR